MVVLLLLGLAAAVVPTWAQPPCRVTRHGQDSGLIRMPDFGYPPLFNVTCNWSFNAQNNRKILIRVDSVYYPPEEARDSSLKLVLDDEIVDIPRNCVHCLKQNFVTAGNVQVFYKSLLLEEFSVDESPSEVATTEVGSFQIRYKVFDPTRCDSPKQPLNGFATLSSRAVGDEVVYGCKAPYDASGSDRAYCIVKDEMESPVPEWSAGPPKCVVTNCSATVYRTAGNGALTSPGYPLYMLPSAMDCSWVIQTEPGSLIRVVISFLQLSGRSGGFGTLGLYELDGSVLGVFNETRDKTLTLSSSSSELTVNLVTTNSQPVKGGFYLEYQSYRSYCLAPLKPDFGGVTYTNLTVGSVSSFSCSSGYILLGETLSLCQSNGTWSAPTPTCVPDLELTVPVFPAEVFTSRPPFPSTSSQLDPTEVFTSKTPSTAAQIEIATDATISPVSEQPKFTKSSKKVKTKPTSKTFHKVAAKAKVSNSSKVLETNLDLVTKSPDEDVSEEQKLSKDVLPVNSAQDKVAKTKSRDNATLSKLGSPIQGVAPRPQDFPKSFQVPKEEQETKLLDVLQEEEAARDEEVLGLKGYIIIGVASALILVILCVVLALVIYKKRFPVRLRFGRKFSTFENPIYLSKDAQHSRELKRLTL